LTAQACGPASASGAINSRFFGMHAPSMPSAFPQATVGAVNLTTNGVYWPSLETSPGAFDFSHLDAVVKAAADHGAKPLLILGQTPQFHSSRPNAAHVVATVPKMAAWRHYVAAVAGRYKARIDYEIWPEPGIKENWAGTKRQLAQLVAAAANIIHTKARSAVVVGPAMVLRMRYQQKFMDAFYGVRVGGKAVGRYVDAVGIDPYPEPKGTPEDSLTLIKKARSILRHRHVRAPLWNVEVNYGVAGSHASVGAWSNRKQQSYLVRNYLLNAGAGVKRVYWLGWFRFSEAAIQLVKPDGVTPTPAAASLRVVTSWLLRQHAGPCTRNAKTHVWSCKLVRKSRASWVYWTTRGKAVVRAPKGSRHVATMTGAVSGTRAGKKLTVTSAPMRVYH